LCRTDKGKELTPEVDAWDDRNGAKVTQTKTSENIFTQNKLGPNCLISTYLLLVRGGWVPGLWHCKGETSAAALLLF